MKKKECPSCAMEVDSKEKACPICGYEFATFNTSQRVIAVLLILVLLWFLVF